MKISGKIFLQFLSSWTLMPLALFTAQILQIAQLHEFVVSVLVITSISPVQVYLNEIYAPANIRYGQSLGFIQICEVTFALISLVGWLAIQLDLDWQSTLEIITFSIGYIWFSLFASTRILRYQACSVIGGKYSYILGSIIPLVFTTIIILYCILMRFGFSYPHILYLLIILPNMFQYIYTRMGWMSKYNAQPMIGTKISHFQESHAIRFFFVISILMALIAQHWKILLAESMVGFSAISIYLISPFSSMWLIISKSNFMTKKHIAKNSFGFYLIPCIAICTLLIHTYAPIFVFLIALATQILNYKFITDIRAFKAIERTQCN